MTMTKIKTVRVVFRRPRDGSAPDRNRARGKDLRGMAGVRSRNVRSDLSPTLAYVAPRAETVRVAFFREGG